MKDAGYPEDIRRYDSDPRSPFYDDREEAYRQAYEEDIERRIEELKAERIAEAFELMNIGTDEACAFLSDAISCSDYSNRLCVVLAAAMTNQRHADANAGNYLVSIIREYAVGDEKDLREEAEREYERERE